MDGYTFVASKVTAFSRRSLHLQSPLEVWDVVRNNAWRRTNCYLGASSSSQVYVLLRLATRDPSTEYLTSESTCHFFNGYNCHLYEFVNYQLPAYELSCLLVGWFGSLCFPNTQFLILVLCLRMFVGVNGVSMQKHGM